jgi:DNA-binding MarR family transcriptional regulator
MESAARATAPGAMEEGGARLEHAWTAFVAAIRCARQPRRDPEGLSLAQYELLRPLLDRQPLRVGELADAAGVRGPTATRMLDTVGRAGLVDRVHSRTDRRHVRISLTRSGHTAVVQKQDQIERARQEVFATLSPAQREDVASFLEAMTGVIGRL